MVSHSHLRSCTTSSSRSASAARVSSVARTFSTPPP